MTASLCRWYANWTAGRPVVQVLKNHGVAVERCRYLEQAGCVSVCINSCKVPTQVNTYTCIRSDGYSSAKSLARVGSGAGAYRCKGLTPTNFAPLYFSLMQEFFKNDMGIDVTLTPNYEDFSCQ